MELDKGSYGTYFHAPTFSIRAPRFPWKLRMSRSESKMNIFYIIGVVVVVVFVAGYLGLHA